MSTLFEMSPCCPPLIVRLADLPACFIVWACSPDAKFLRGNGKYLWCNWDVEELKSRKEELSKPDQLTVTMNGWPFGSGADGSKDALKF